MNDQPAIPVKRMRNIWFAVLAIMLLAVVSCGYLFNGKLKRLFGPPAVVSQEAYARKADGPMFDHSSFNALLARHVSSGGWVDYAGLVADPGALDAYISSLADAPFDAMGRDQKLALLINAYNAFTLRLILDYWDDGKLKSIRDIPAAKRWDDVRWRVGGRTWSLGQIEHEQIRPKFVEPRIHFALVCAAVGCPPLRSEAYVADRLDEQLDDQMRYVHTHDRWFKLSSDKQVVELTPLYNWYRGDFVQYMQSVHNGGDVLDYVAMYVPQIADAEPTIRWLDYDWSLNVKR